MFPCHLYSGKFERCFNTYREMINSVILVSGRAAVDKKASYVLSWALTVSYWSKMYFIIIEGFVFSGLSRNRCTNNLSLLKSSFFISLFIFYFVFGITGGSVKF